MVKRSHSLLDLCCLNRIVRLCILYVLKLFKALPSADALYSKLKYSTISILYTSILSILDYVNSAYINWRPSIRSIALDIQFWQQLTLILSTSWLCQTVLYTGLAYYVPWICQVKHSITCINAFDIVNSRNCQQHSGIFIWLKKSR